MPALRGDSRSTIRVRGEDLGPGDVSIASLLEGRAARLEVPRSAELVVLFFETRDGSAFEVSIEVTDASGTTYGSIDQSVDGSLASSGGIVSTSIELPSEYVDVALADTSGDDHNRVDGSLRFV